MYSNVLYEYNMLEGSDNLSITVLSIELKFAGATINLILVMVI